MSQLSGYQLHILSAGSDLTLYRGRKAGAAPVLALAATAQQASTQVIERLLHEQGLASELDAAWAAIPIALVRHDGRPVLVIEDRGGEPLESQLGGPMETERFLRLAISIAAALAGFHGQGLVHRDLNPAHLLVGPDGEVRLTGLGLASRLPRERQEPTPPEFIAGTLAYMAPEQTGRMNRSIDSRSDLYALGVVFYRMLTGTLPFAAADAMEWIHCHIARTPVSPSERVGGIPLPLGQIVMKLLAKTAEERYQTAAGVEQDLRRCLAQWEAQRRISEFSLGTDDLTDQLLIPEKLYGRTREAAVLLDAFQAVADRGDAQVVLVSGYSGAGKSSVVNELHKALVPSRCLFASGKFDQYKRDIPYATLAQALRGLIEHLLSKSEAELRGWQEALRTALGPNGQLMVNLIPQLELVIGKQRPVPRLPPQDARRAFHIVFQRFLAVLATEEHPLVLFLDDLQWLDRATLDLLDDLMAQRTLRHLLLIGAYRENEVGTAHPLLHTVESIRRSGAMVGEVKLAPLAAADVVQLVADALHCIPSRAAPLGALVHDKTGGNPLFVIQFLHALADERLLTFNHRERQWSWSLHRIQATRYTDNVVDLMVAKLNRLAAPSLHVLQQLACIGNRASFELLATVCETTAEKVYANLWEAVRSGFVLRSDTAYSFQHDRVQEAAYSLIPPRVRAETHLRIGRLLAARTLASGRRDAVFEIVDHFNRSMHLIVEREERKDIAALNLEAAERARSSTAYASALRYATAAAAFLPDDCWSSDHSLAFRVELLRAECAFLSDSPSEASDRIAALSVHARGTVERSRLACLQIDMYTTFDEGARAIDLGLAFLRGLGMDWPEHPDDEDVRADYEQTRAELATRSEEDLLSSPMMADADAVATLDVLSKLTVPAFFTNVPLFALLVCRTVRLILANGNGDASPAAYVRLGIITARLFGDYQGAYRLGQLGRDLVERRDLARFRPVVYFLLGNMVLPWTRHYHAGRDLISIAFADARAAGYLYYATVCARGMSTNRFAAGEPLELIQKEAEEGVAFGREVKFESFTDLLRGNLALARMLRGLTPRFGSLDNADFEEADFEQRYAGKSGMVLFMYWTTKLKSRYFAGDYAGALDATARLRPLLAMNLSTTEPVEYRFYGALSHAAAFDGATAIARARHLSAASAHHRQLQEWAGSCPENFASCADLVAAEIARMSVLDRDAMRLYERAIRSARENGLAHIEALAYQLAADFYAGRDLPGIADLHLAKARDGYLRWGATAKVRQLEALHPSLLDDVPQPSPGAGLGAPVENLDLATVITISQAVSSEIVLDKLLATLVRTAMQQGGAQRGLLIVPGDGKPRVEAEASIQGDAVGVELHEARVTETTLPRSVLHYVLRTLEPVILDDALVHESFSSDPYVRQQRARSVFCLPLLTQGKLSGVLYLENNLAPGVFMPRRTEVLRMLASQAAAALENARLYRDLAEREARIRRLVDANIIGTYIWEISLSSGEPVPVLVDANDAFLRMVGYDRTDLAAGRVTRNTLSPPEWRERDALTMAQVQAAGSAAPFEKEYLRKDGTRVPVLMGLATFDERRLDGLAFVIDLSERKRAEAEARDNERRYREAEAALAHAIRVATMGQLTATIAHEVSQPVVGVVTNADTALRRLRASPPNVDGAAQALERIVRDGTRAREVIERIRALVRKAPPRKDRVDINETVREVIGLTKGQAAKNRVLVHTRLVDDPPWVEGDRVQLQQVLLNLIVNGIEAMLGAAEGPRELSVSTSDAANGILVTVSDSGPTLEESQLTRVFDAFYSTKPDGLGMGLSICRSIVEAHGGKLWASAVAPRGSSFQFTLPRAEEMQAGA